MYTLEAVSKDDFRRDVLKSDTAVLEVPQLDLVMEMGTLGSMYTTVEGLLNKVSNRSYRGGGGGGVSRRHDQGDQTAGYVIGGWFWAMAAGRYSSPSEANSLPACARAPTLCGYVFRFGIRLPSLRHTPLKSSKSCPTTPPSPNPNRVPVAPPAPPISASPRPTQARTSLVEGNPFFSGDSATAHHGKESEVQRKFRVFLERY